jgi:hypothetical protein
MFAMREQRHHQRRFDADHGTIIADLQEKPCSTVFNDAFTLDSDAGLRHRGRVINAGVT